MTLVEFFERSVVENICTSIAHAPDRVILIGHQKNLMIYDVENMEEDKLLKTIKGLWSMN